MMIRCSRFKYQSFHETSSFISCKVTNTSSTDIFETCLSDIRYKVHYHHELRRVHDNFGLFGAVLESLMCRSLSCVGRQNVRILLIFDTNVISLSEGGF